MKPSPKLRPTVWDGLVVLCVAALAIGLAVFQWRGGGQEDLTAAVSVDGVEIDRVSLERAAGDLTLLLPVCGALVMLSGDDLYLRVYHPDRRLAELLAQLAGAEGLFFYRAP